MDSLVERLRHCSDNTNDEYLHELTGRAADELTRLTAENARLRETVMDEDWLEYVISDSLEMDWQPRDAAKLIIQRATAALNELDRI